MSALPTLNPGLRPVAPRRRALVQSWPVVALRFAALLIISAIFAFPFYWMVVTSLGTLRDVYSVPPVLWPSWVFANYVTTWKAAAWPRFYLNTILISAATTALCLCTATLAGYAFAAIPFRGKRVLFWLLIAIYMVPSEVTLVPNFITLSSAGWINTYQAQILPFGASVFGIFLMRQFFLTLPGDLWDAARLDGCGHLRYLWSIAAPLARPALVTVGLFEFVGAWNAFLWPLIVTSTDSVRPLQVALSAFDQAQSGQPMQLAAAALMTTAPILIVFFFAQRQLVGGIATTGIRG